MRRAWKVLVELSKLSRGELKLLSLYRNAHSGVGGAFLHKSLSKPTSLTATAHKQLSWRYELGSTSKHRILGHTTGAAIDVTLSASPFLDF